MPPFIGGMPVPFTLRRSLARDVFQTPLADFLLAHQELLNLLRHRHGEAVHEPDGLRDFEGRDFSLAERLDFFRSGGLAGFELSPRQHGFAQAGVGDADDIDVGDLGMGVQEVLDFARVDVLSPADDGVFGAAPETEIAIGTHGGQVARVQPAFRIDDRGRGFGIVVVPLHDQVAAGAKFALLSDGQPFAGFGIGDLHFGIGQRRAHRGDAQFHGVVDARHGDHRRTLGLAVSDGHFGAMHALGYRAHDFDRAGRSGHHAGAQAGEIELLEVRVDQLGDEHRGHAVERGGALAVHRFERGAGVELGGRQDLYATAIGVMDGTEETYYPDILFFYDDPHTIYD